MKTKLLFIFLLSFTFMNLKAQTVNVNSSSYSPAAPLDCNNLTITVNGVVNCINFPFDSTSYSVSGSTIEIGVYYSGGFICAGALNPYSHAVNVGMIPQGTYTVNIRGYLNLTQDDALNAPNITVGSCCGTDANFTSNKSVGCTDDTNGFIFTNTSTGATSNEWFLDGFSIGTSTNLTLPLTTIGTYDIKLVTSNGTCSDSITQTFGVFQSPTISLGNDTSSCVGTNYNIIAPTGFSSYSWTNNASTSSIATVSSTNTYKVTAIDNNGCSAEDSILVTFNALPAVNLGPDTTACEGETITLDAGSFSSYEWNTTETTQTIDVTSSFSYSVEVTDANGCKNSDAIAVFFNTAPNVNLGQDTFDICAGNSITLNPGTFDTYLWSTSETTSTIDVSTQGTISVTVTDAANCTNSDDTYVRVNSLPIVNFGSDTFDFCSGNSVTLDPGTFDSYNWSTSANSSTISVNSEGTYSVTVTENNCTNTGSVFVKENALPTVDLGADQDLCKSDKLVLNGGMFASYLWNDASTAQNLEVNGTDFPEGNNTFSLSATDDNGCEATDEVIINVKTCDVGIQSILENLNISIFPNPVQNELNIFINENTSIEIKIFNVLGKELLTIENSVLNNSTSIDISNFVNGLYFIEFKHENEQLIKSFVKSK